MLGPATDAIQDAVDAAVAAATQGMGATQDMDLEVTPVAALDDIKQTLFDGGHDDATSGDDDAISGDNDATTEDDESSESQQVRRPAGQHSPSGQQAERGEPTCSSNVSPALAEPRQQARRPVQRPPARTAPSKPPHTLVQATGAQAPPAPHRPAGGGRGAGWRQDRGTQLAISPAGVPPRACSHRAQQIATRPRTGGWRRQLGLCPPRSPHRMAGGGLSGCEQLANCLCGPG